MRIDGCNTQTRREKDGMEGGAHSEVVHMVGDSEEGAVVFVAEVDGMAKTCTDARATMRS
jgi:hypothetical protein